MGETFPIPPLDESASIRLILMRHGETVADVQGRCCGKLDVPLSRDGEKQILSRLDLLRSLAPHVIYASPFRRAFQSAYPIGKALDIEVRCAQELREIDFGHFEGLSYGDIKNKWPEQFKQWMEYPTDVEFPGGETFGSMKTRVLGFLDQVVQTHFRQKVLLLSHAGVNRIIVARALGLAWTNIFRIDQSYAAITVVDFFPATAVVRLLNA